MVSDDVLQCVRNGAATAFDVYLLTEGDLPMDAIRAALTELERCGKIEQSGIGKWRAVRPKPKDVQGRLL